MQQLEEFEEEFSEAMGESEEELDEGVEVLSSSDLEEEGSPAMSKDEEQGFSANDTLGDAPPDDRWNALCCVWLLFLLQEEPFERSPDVPSFASTHIGIHAYKNTNSSFSRATHAVGS